MKRKFYRLEINGKGLWSTFDHSEEILKLKDKLGACFENTYHDFHYSYIIHEKSAKHWFTEKAYSDKEMGELIMQISSFPEVNLLILENVFNKNIIESISGLQVAIY